MSDIIVTKDQQLIILSRHYYQHRPNKVWEGCLEIEKADYTYADIMKLANDEPETIVRVLKLGQDGIDDITDSVLDWEEANRK